MLRRSVKDFEGYYVIKRTPVRMKPHNSEAWAKIEALAAKKPDGCMHWDELCISAKDHQHGTKTAEHPHQFIMYCNRVGWLEKVR